MTANTTALAHYQRLEATGLWRATPDAQRRDVVISLGEATLMIATPADDPLTHWSLAAVTRLNPGRRPAIYAPGPDTEERLELEDAEMIGAIEKLRSAIARKTPQPGRLRLWIGGSLSAALIGLTLFWLPDALRDQTVAVLPPASRSEIGARLLDEVARLAGPLCTTPRGLTALARVAQRAVGPDALVAPRLAVLPSALPETLILPGGNLVVTATLAEDHESPAVLAGYVIASEAHRAAHDPMLTLLSQAGLRATLRLLTTGEISDDVLRAHAADLLSRRSPDTAAHTLLPHFRQARISSEPYAYARDPTGEHVLELIEGDPMRGQPAESLLDDGDWVSLQDICRR